MGGHFNNGQVNLQQKARLSLTSNKSICSIQPYNLSINSSTIYSTSVGGTVYIENPKGILVNRIATSVLGDRLRVTNAYSYARINCAERVTVVPLDVFTVTYSGR